MDGSIHELGELVIRVTGGSGGWEGEGRDIIIIIVGKVNTADETENRLGKLGAGFN